MSWQGIIGVALLIVLGVFAHFRYRAHENEWNRYHEAKRMIHAGKYVKALASLEEVDRHFPNSVSLLKEMERCQIELGMAQRASRTRFQIAKIEQYTRLIRYWSNYDYGW